MPEYLAPGVYVEEVNTGTRPIEGVSTSTTGLIGATERGPENRPILVTSIGEFRRIFGDHLNFETFTDAGGVVHAYLPHAVDGYFTNGGRRAYVVRVLPEDAAHGSRFLFDRAVAGDAGTVLLRAVGQGTGSGASPPLLLALDPAGMAVNDWLRVGDGSRAEYRQIAAVDPGGGPVHLALNFALNHSHNAGDAVEQIPNTPDGGTYAGTGGVFALAEDAAGGDREIIIDGLADAASFTTPLGGSGIFEIGAAAVAEYLRATAATPDTGTRIRLTLESPLLVDHATGDPVTAMDTTPAAVTTATLDIDASAGDLLLFADPTGFATGDLILLDRGGANEEIRRVGELSELDLDVGAYRDYAYGAVFELVTVGDDDRTVLGNVGLVVSLDRVDGLAAGIEVEFDNDPTNTAIIAAVDAAADEITLQAAPPVNFNTPARPAAKALTAAVAAGRIVLSLNNRLGLADGDVLRLGVGPDEEYVSIAEVTGPRGTIPDAGTVVLDAPLRQAHANGTEARRQHPPQADPARQAMQTVLPAEEGATELYVNDGTGFLANEIVRVQLASGEVLFHRLGANAAALAPREIELTEAVSLSHEEGQPLAERRPQILVRALDRGGAGNRILVAVNDEVDGLARHAELDSIAPPLEMTLTTLTGVEAGTILELRDPDTGAVIGDPLKVRSIDRTDYSVELDPPGLSLAQISAHTMAVNPLLVRSREFALAVFVLEQPHPAIPTRATQIRDSEVFRHLSLDPRHNRYIHKVIGTTWTPPNPEDDDGETLRLWDQRSEGESAYIRVRDQAPDDATAESVRLGPETLVDVLPSGLPRAARHPLGRGTDSPATMGNAMYTGSDNDEPLLRTGIYAFRNIRDLSLVAAPGQTTAAIQQALIDHCETDRYRYAVLDAHGPTRDSLADVQNQRQQFDTSYASIYYPWATIPEPMPENLANIRQIPIPPSGHVLGIYARTDNDRGVHKAPANEPMRGITGLQRAINKGEHDILNPRNINVIRDFREENRGIRVWGARNITSDSDYKYVNVRRLLIFIEASIDIGLQWVVFEPNAEETWARVRRAITNFLTVVWRNGALEGASVEEAFFVRCDRTTMTQQDIDTGRLICVVGVAPVKPAEFVIVRIGLWTANAQQ